MSMFSLNANDSQQIGRRIFRRPMVFMRHRARRMEHRIARAVGAGSVAGAVAGASVARAGKPATNQPPKKRENTSASMGSRVGSAVGAVMDTKNKVRDSACRHRLVMPSILPNRKQRIMYRTLSVALWKNGKTDRNSVHKNATCTGKISHRKSRNYRKHRKQGRRFMRMDQRQPELPEAMNAQLPHLFQNLHRPIRSQSRI